MNPFTQAVAAPTYQALRQQQGQERAQQQAQAIKAGAFGGDRAGLERANLARQQELGTAQAIAPIFQQGYQQALQTAQQQQGVGLAAEQANRAAFQQGAQQIAGLGTGAQQAALQGAQAQLAAGTAEQQTNQADLTARYQQFLQERGYPFQTAQFLANIAMGTGALSGSTTTSTQPAGFFSDERLKEDIKRVGETDDGLPIYSYRYKGDKKTQIGLIAQDVEKEKPEAVGLAPAADGKLYKTVDYKKATEDCPHREYGGGLDVNSMGGAVMDPGSFAGGGMVDPNDMKSILAAIGKPVDVYGNKSTLGADAIGGTGIVPSGGVAIPKLVTASNVAANRPTTASDVVGNVKSGVEAYKMGKAGLIGSAPTKDDPSGSAGLIGGQGKLGGKNIFSEVGDFFKSKEAAAHGGLIVDRHHYEDGGDVNNDTNEDPNEDRAHVPSSALPSDVLASAPKPAQLATAQTHQGRSGMDDIKDIMSIGKTAMSMGMFASGGTVDDLGYIVRQHHQDGERVVADEATGVVPPENIPEDYDTKLSKTMQAIKRIESGGRSDALGPATRTGDRAHGLYQIMGANIPTWTEEALGRRMTPEEFRNDPEAQEATAKHRMGLYLKQYNDPAQVASMWFSGRPIEKAGESADVTGTTVPRYVSMFNKYYGGAESPDLPARGAKEAEYREEPKESGLSLKGIGDTVTSDKFLVPFLSFVGSTLASKSPTLGGALGEGIVGGVSGYQQNKKMQSELAKGVLDIVKDRFNITTDPKTQQTIYFNKATGQTISAAQYAKAVGDIAESMGVPRGVLGISTEGTEVRGPSGTTQPGEFTRPGQEALRVGAGAKSGTTEQGKAEGAPAAKKEAAAEITDTRRMNPTQLADYAVANKEKYKLVGPKDPDVLWDEANQWKTIAASARLAGNATEAAAATQSAKDALDRRDQYIKDAISQEVENNKQLMQARNEDAKESYKSAQAREASYKSDRALITRTADIMADYRAGRLSDARAGIGDIAATLNIQLPSGFFNAAANDELIKSALTQVVAQVGERGLGRAPGTAIKTLEQTIANPKINPGASFALLGRTLGDLDKDHDRDVSYLKKGRGADYGEHIIEWNEKVDPTEYYRRAYSSIPEPRGMDPTHRESLLKTYKYQPKVRMTSEERSTAPADVEPAQVATPEPLRNVQGLQWSESRKQYRDSQGNIYDASGKRVQ
jgi:hypothetical protein